MNFDDLYSEWQRAAIRHAKRLENQLWRLTMKCLADSTCTFRPKNRTGLAVHTWAVHKVKLSDLEEKIKNKKKIKKKLENQELKIEKTPAPPMADFDEIPGERKLQEVHAFVADVIPMEKRDLLMELVEEFIRDKAISFEVRLHYAIRIMEIRQAFKDRDMMTKATKVG